jgi:hypothetical protein
VSAQKGEVETILRSDAFSANTLRDLVDEKNLDVNKVRTEDMINALLRYSWSDDEIEELKHRLEELQRENQTMGYYVAELNGLPNTTQQPQHKELREALLIDEADRTDDEIRQKGFEVQSVSSDNLTAIYWTQTKNWEINSLGNLTSRQRTYDIGVDFYLEDERVHLFVDNFGKMGEARSAVEDIGVELGEIGHSSLTRQNANEMIREFVESLKDGLEQKREQLSIQDFSDEDGNENLLRIKEVKIDVGDGDTEKADLEGKQDIFTDDTVEHLVEDKNGKITGLRGVMTLGDIDFRVKAGSPGKLGRVSVRKKSSKGGVKKLNEAFDFLYDSYLEYFIECEK